MRSAGSPIGGRWPRARTADCVASPGSRGHSRQIQGQPCRRVVLSAPKTLQCPSLPSQELGLQAQGQGLRAQEASDDSRCECQQPTPPTTPGGAVAAPTEVTGWVWPVGLAGSSAGASGSHTRCWEETSTQRTQVETQTGPVCWTVAGAESKDNLQGAPAPTGQGQIWGVMGRERHMQAGWTESQGQMRLGQTERSEGQSQVGAGGTQAAAYGKTPVGP